MNAPQSEFYPTKETEVWIVFNLRIAGSAEHLHSERAVWQEVADIEALDKDHFVLIIHLSEVRRLAR